MRDAIDSGDLETARVLERSLQKSGSGNAELLVLCGRLAYVDNNLDKAQTLLSEALRQQPSLVEAHRWLAMTSMRQGMAEQALAHALEAERISPGDADLRVIIGVVHYQRKDYAVARQAFAAAAQADDGNADAHRNLAAVCFRQNDVETAARHFRRLTELSPRSSFGWSGYASCLAELGREEEAWECFARAAAENPAPQLCRDHAAALFNAGRIAEARAQIEAGLAADPGNALLHVARANCDLIERGDLPAAWAEYEWRLRLDSGRYGERVPRWNGECCGGRTLLVYAEQGLGDALLFARYISRLSARADRIVLQVPPALAKLLRASAARFGWNISAWIEGTARIGPDKVPYDLEVPLLSLVHACRFPVERTVAPYLAVEEDLRAYWARRLGPRRGRRLRAGLVWAGNPARREDALRSILPEQLAPLGALPNVDFVSLQKDARPQYVNSPLPLPLVDLGADIGDFADTAAIMQNLDLVLSIDTAAAHLAGALGVPCWVLLSKIPDWRWQMGGVEQPWYSGHRSFVIERQRDWTPLMERVAAELARMKLG